MKRILLLGSLLLLPFLTFGQLSLEEYRTAVLAHSYALQKAEAVNKEAAARTRLAWSKRLPTLSASGDFSLSFRHETGIKPWNFSLQPRIVATLYGEGLQAAWRQAAWEEAATQSDWAFTQLDVRYAADYAYWNLSAMQHYYEATRQYVEIIRSLKTVIEERFREGYIAKSDVLLIESRLSSAEYDLLATTQNLEVALHNFNILRGEESEAEVHLTTGMLDAHPLPQRQTIDQILDRRPDVAAAESRYWAAEEEIRKSRATYLPSIQVGVGGIWQPDSPNRRGSTRLDGSLFGGISIPIFGWGARRHTLQATRAAAQQIASDTALLYEEILREERNGWSALVESLAQISAADEGLRIAQESLDLSTYSYNEGLLTILDVLQAQLDWIQLYTNAITAHFNFAVARSTYQRTTAEEE